MRGLASAQVSPGAQTCILVGGLEHVDGLDLTGYKAVLWFAPGGSPTPDCRGWDARNVAIEAVVPFDAGWVAGALDRLIVRDSLHLPSIFIAEDTLGDQAEAFLPVIEVMVGQVQSHKRARNARRLDGFLYQSSLLANLPVYLRRRVPSAWAGALKGLPAFICGAGPSLDAALARLAEIAPHGVVFAADSALKALEKHGIGVDFSVSVDVRKSPGKCLPESGRFPARMVVTGKSPPDWKQRVDESRLYFLSGSQLTEEWMATKGVKNTDVAVRENCGIAALQLAVYLGCGPIALFGMDHAVDGKNPAQWHHQDLAASLTRPVLDATTKLTMVPGNYQEEIATVIYWEWRSLDERCAALPPGLLFNVTDRGARLRNTTVVLPERFSVGARPGEKTERLAHLAPAEALNPMVAEPLLGTMRTTAARVEPSLAKAGQALQRGDHRRAARTLHGVFQDEAVRGLLGNYCLKIMPHLNQPESVDAALWAELVTECRELIALARNLR